MYHTIIGIDVSKDDFVVARHGCLKTQTFNNTNEGFALFNQHYHQELSECLVVLEVTGGYEHALTLYLEAMALECTKLLDYKSRISFALW